MGTLRVNRIAGGIARDAAANFCRRWPLRATGGFCPPASIAPACDRRAGSMHPFFQARVNAWRVMQCMHVGERGYSRSSGARHDKSDGTRLGAYIGACDLVACCACQFSALARASRALWCPLRQRGWRVARGLSQDTVFHRSGARLAQILDRPRVAVVDWHGPCSTGGSPTWAGVRPSPREGATRARRGRSWLRPRSGGVHAPSQSSEFAVGRATCRLRPGSALCCPLGSAQGPAFMPAHRRQGAT